MKNPLTALLARCSHGFTIRQKVGITLLGMLYIVSPIDVCPDLFLFLGWLDDGYVIYFLARVWGSPTLPGDGGGSTSPAKVPVRQSTQQPLTRVAVVHRERVGGAR